jgi:hypothetical protein
MGKVTRARFAAGPKAGVCAAPGSSSSTRSGAEGCAAAVRRRLPVPAQGDDDGSLVSNARHVPLLSASSPSSLPHSWAVGPQSESAQSVPCFVDPPTTAIRCSLDVTMAAAALSRTAAAASPRIAHGCCSCIAGQDDSSQCPGAHGYSTQLQHTAHGCSTRLQAPASAPRVAERALAAACPMRRPAGA